MREICTSGSMSGEWKRGMAELVRHRQTKEPETDRPRLNHRATPRLYLDDAPLSHASPTRERGNPRPYRFIPRKPPLASLAARSWARRSSARARSPAAM